MAALAMPPQRVARDRTPRAVSPREIIASARSAPAEMTGALAMSGLTAALMWGAFTPLDFGPLAWICLAPLLLLARLPRPTRRMYRAVYLGGALFWLPSLQWMRLGHPAMYGAWLALSLYLACYYPMFLALVRVAVWRFRIPLTLAAPVLWVGLELLRAHLMSGFCWYNLGHTQYRWLELIQVSDLVGAYGVSFLPALTAACLVELLPPSLLAKWRLLPASPEQESQRDLSAWGRWWRVGTCLTLFGAVLTYGYTRRHNVEFQPGLRVAAIQGNVPSEVKHDQRDWRKVQLQHERLTGIAVKQQPDLIIWPETMFRYPLLVTPAGVTDEDLRKTYPEMDLSWLRDLKVEANLARLSQMAGAAMVIGLETIEIDSKRIRTYNSAALVRPNGKLAGRYDKLHRVPFGEYIPLGDSLPFLHRLTPFGSGFGIEAGSAPSAFDHQGSRFAPIICFEDTIPHLVRDIVNAAARPGDGGAKKVDFLVNLTNDGWFHGSSELDQHLITAAFRCVECRTPMVRAVNTGISAIIDGDGMIRQRASGLRTGRSKQDEAVVVDHVPLDARQSLYLKYGDWFAGVCLGGCVFLGIMGVSQRFWLQRGGKSPEGTSAPKPAG
ncbi:MAG: apolipoprotein N-acyltransferase [Planctomycetales bacterium]